MDMWSISGMPMIRSPGGLFWMLGLRRVSGPMGCEV